MNAAALLTVIAGFRPGNLCRYRTMTGSRIMADQVGDMFPGMTGGCAGCPSV